MIRDTGVNGCDNLRARADPAEADAAALLERAGWQTVTHSVAELAARYGRTIGLPAGPSDAPGPTAGAAAEPSSRGGFVTATL